MKTGIKILTTLFALGLGSQVAAKTCEMSIDSTDQMQYDKKEMSVAADCTEVKLTLTHSGKLAKNVMGHNWVLSMTDNMQGIVQDGMNAGLDNQYLKPGDDRVIAFTDVVGGGESTSITFDVSKLEKGGDYSFFCSFPGHYALMKGKFIVN